MPGGEWTQADVGAATTRPGAYFNFVAQALDLLNRGDRGTVAITGRADWGPVDTPTTLTTEGDATAVFGAGLSLAKLAKEALRGGASTVLALRIIGSSAAKGTVTLDDGVAAAAMTLTALYEGARTDNITVSVVTNPVGGQDLVVKENGVEIERHNAVDNDEMVAVVNADSKIFTAAVDGAADRTFDLVSDVAVAGGDSGAGVVAGDYTAAQALWEAEVFDCYVQDDDTTTANQDAVTTWTQTRRAEGQRFISVMGGAAAETAATAQARAAVQDDENVVYVSPGYVNDDGVTFTGQEAAARVAGLIAGRGFTKSITFAELLGVADVETKLSASDIQANLGAGVCVLVQDGTDVRVERGLNTFTSTTATKGDSFRKIRTIMTLNEVADGLYRGFAGFIGQVTNDEDGQRSMIGAGQSFLDELVNARALKPGATLALDPAQPPTADQVFVQVGITPLDSVEQIFTTINIST